MCPVWTVENPVRVKDLNPRPQPWQGCAPARERQKPVGFFPRVVAMFASRWGFYGATVHGIVYHRTLCRQVVGKSGDTAMAWRVTNAYYPANAD